MPAATKTLKKKSRKMTAVSQVPLSYTRGILYSTILDCYFKVSQARKQLPITNYNVPRSYTLHTTLLVAKMNGIFFKYH